MKEHNQEGHGARQDDLLILAAGELTKHIVDAVREPLVILDGDLKVISASRSFYDAFKVTPEETENKLIYELGCRQWDIPDLRRLLEEIIPEHTLFDNFEVEHDFPAIGKRTMLLNARRIPGAPGKPKIILLAIEDITELKDRFRILFESSRDAIMTLEPPLWKFTSCNSAAVQLFGARDAAEFISKEPWEMSPDFQPDNAPSPEKAKKMIQKAMDECVNFFEWTHKRLDGKEFFASVLLNRVEIEKGRPFLLATVRDITERTMMENALTNQKRLLQSVTDNASVALFFIDEKQQCVFMNPAAEQLTGYALDEVRGLSLHDVVHHAHPDGLPYPPNECPIEQAFQQRSKIEREGVFVHKDGHSYDVAFNACPLRIERGTPVGMIIEVKEITERKKSEESAKQRIRELEVFFYKASIGREERILELKKEIEQLKKELGKNNG